MNETAKILLMHAVSAMFAGCGNSYVNAYLQEWLEAAKELGAYDGPVVGTIKNVSEAWEAHLEKQGGLPDIQKPSKGNSATTQTLRQRLQTLRQQLRDRRDLEDYAEKLEANLTGTCRSITEAVGLECPYSIETIEAMIGARGNIELCNGCGWWCENSEMEEVKGEILCADCRESNEDEESQNED